ncbi:hypothetical protein [Thalassotalea ganghwensis]
MDFSRDEYCHIEAPFNYRHSCWFCGEPASHELFFPHPHLNLLQCSHSPLIINCCKECQGAAHQSIADNIWQVATDVKKFLVKKYHKDLAIGLNWTQDELANSQFEGGNFESFQRSAWFMFEVAQARVSFQGWPIIVNGIEIESASLIEETFSVNGTDFPSLHHAIAHYTKAYGLAKGYLADVVTIVGQEQFSFAVRLCREMKDATPDERRLALEALID